MRRVPLSLALSLSSLVLASPLAAQERPVLRVLPEPMRAGTLLPAAAPVVERVTFDVETGELRDRSTGTLDSLPGGAVGLSVAPCFDNSDLGPCGMQAHTPWTIGNLPGDELLDWGVKSCGGSSMVQSLTIAYRTTELDVQDGGPGATLSFGFYRGTLGWNRVGTEVFRQTFTGLPAQRFPNGDTHSAPFVFLTIDFGTQPLLVPDGPIGWGYMLLDNQTPIATGALLVKAPNPLTSVVDALDVFSPGTAVTGTYLGTFNFGSVCNFPPLCCPDASTWLQIVEAPPAASVIAGGGTNPQVFSERVRARIGQGWVTSFDLSAQPAVTGTMILLSRGTLAPPRPSTVGEILIDPARWFPPISTAGIAMGTSLHVIPIPSSTSLVGFSFFAQGVLLRPGGRVLTNALEVPVGL